MKVVVVGGSGYIGTCIAKELIERGHIVTVFDRQIFYPTPFFSNNWIHKDIRDATLEDFSDAEIVLDYSGLSNDPTGEINVDLTRDINVNGRAHLAATAKAAGVKNYIFASSCSVYGKNTSGKPLSEDADCSPLTTYAKSAFEMEGILKDLASTTFRVLAIRHGTVYGFSKKMRLDLVVNLMTKSVIEKNSIIVLGGGLQMRPLVSLNSITSFIAHILDGIDSYSFKSSFDVVNLSEKNVSIRELAYWLSDTLSSAHKEKITIEIAPDDADARDYSVDTKKMCESYQFKIDGLRSHSVLELFNMLRNFDRNDIRTRTQDWYQLLLQNEVNINSVGVLKR